MYKHYSFYKVLQHHAVDSNTIIEQKSYFHLSSDSFFLHNQQVVITNLRNNYFFSKNGIEEFFVFDYNSVCARSIS